MRWHDDQRPRSRAMSERDTIALSTAYLVGTAALCLVIALFTSGSTRVGAVLVALVLLGFILWQYVFERRHPPRDEG